jgi:hypothetical protein
MRNWKTPTRSKMMKRKLRKRNRTH